MPSLNQGQQLSSPSQSSLSPSKTPPLLQLPEDQRLISGSGGGIPSGMQEKFGIPSVPMCLPQLQLPNIRATLPGDPQRRGSDNTATMMQAVAACQELTKCLVNATSNKIPPLLAQATSIAGQMDTSDTSNSSSASRRPSYTRRFPCRARRVKSATHSETEAVLEVPPDAEHGRVVVCSNEVCASSGRQFRWCSICQQPVAKRNFMKRHSHGIITSLRYTMEDYMHDERAQQEAAQQKAASPKNKRRVRRTSKFLESKKQQQQQQQQQDETDPEDIAAATQNVTSV